MAKYNGHKNWNQSPDPKDCGSPNSDRQSEAWRQWNVSLWINNNKELYAISKDIIEDNENDLDAAATNMMLQLVYSGITHTPDGAPYSVSSIRAAMVGM